MSPPNTLDDVLALARQLGLDSASADALGEEIASLLSIASGELRRTRTALLLVPASVRREIASDVPDLADVLDTGALLVRLEALSVEDQPAPSPTRWFLASGVPPFDDWIEMTKRAGIAAAAMNEGVVRRAREAYLSPEERRRRLAVSEAYNRVAETARKRTADGRDEDHKGTA